MYLTIKESSRKEKNYSFKSLADFEKLIAYIGYENRSKEATLHLYEQKLTFLELLRIKKLLFKSNLNLIKIHSNIREILISAKSLKIEGYFSKDSKNISNPILNKIEETENITRFGMVRSGDKISSNGNLIIIGDVNPGSQISAKNNIYVWGKLCGIAIAGERGNDNCTISSLYLNPLQLRINKTVAIGPKEKPNGNYPEIAIIEKGKIIIKPLIIDN
tara:strand:+ start:2606 stop:3259 length:654 start_codon:yes stop_codon:yes gene_type:complete